MLQYLLPFAVVLIPLGIVAAVQDKKPMESKQDPKKTAQPAGPEIGKPAPAFRVNDHEGTAVSVGGETDHWTIVAFYPKASTPG